MKNNIDGIVQGKKCDWKTSDSLTMRSQDGLIYGGGCPIEGVRITLQETTRVDIMIERRSHNCLCDMGACFY